MANDQPMWGNNRAIAPTPEGAIVAVDLGDNFTVKGHHLSMIKDRQFYGRARADPHKHIPEFVEICGMFRYGNTNVDAIKLKLFPSSLADDANVWFNELSPGVITTWEQMRQAFIDSQFKEIKGEMKDMQDGCNSCGGPHPSSECDDKQLKIRKTMKPTIHTEVTEEEDIEETTTSGLTYDSPVNPNAKTTVIHDDSDDEADEAEKDRLRKEKMEERYAKFIYLIKEVRINVSLVDVLAGMPNYGKFLKYLMSKKSKMEQISDAFLNEECSVIVQNKLPPKLGDPRSFLILCTILGLVEYLALADLGASIKLMPYSMYASLSGNTLKPTRMKLNLGVGDDRITFLIDKARQHSYSNDDTCFCVDVIDKVTKEELDALLDDSKPFSTTSKKINESSLDHEFKEFMAIEIKEIPKQEEEVEDNFEELTLEENLRIKNSIQDPPTDLVMKPLPKHLEYAFLEKESLLLVVIFALLKHDEKKRLVSILKKHK
ncbi:hypothetical protein Tco_0323660 [Tanacetum coccineum]